MAVTAYRLAAGQPAAARPSQLPWIWGWAAALNSHGGRLLPPAILSFVLSAANQFSLLSAPILFPSTPDELKTSCFGIVCALLCLSATPLHSFTAPSSLAWIQKTCLRVPAWVRTTRLGVRALARCKQRKATASPSRVSRHPFEHYSVIPS